MPQEVVKIEPDRAISAQLVSFPVENCDGSLGMAEVSAMEVAYGGRRYQYLQQDVQGNYVAAFDVLSCEVVTLEFPGEPFARGE